MRCEAYQWVEDLGEVSGCVVGWGYPWTPPIPGPRDLFTEEFELDTIENADLRPNLWFRYVDDTFVVWPHGKTALQEFLLHLNSQHPLTKFTMGKLREEQHNLLPGCSSHTQSRWHPLPTQYTASLHTHRSVSTQLFVPSSTL